MHLALAFLQPVVIEQRYLAEATAERQDAQQYFEIRGEGLGCHKSWAVMSQRTLDRFRPVSPVKDGVVGDSPNMEEHRQDEVNQIAAPGPLQREIAISASANVARGNRSE